MQAGGLSDNVAYQDGLSSAWGKVPKNGAGNTASRLHHVLKYINDEAEARGTFQLVVD